MNSLPESRLYIHLTSWMPRKYLRWVQFHFCVLFEKYLISAKSFQRVTKFLEFFGQQTLPKQTNFREISKINLRFQEVLVSNNSLHVSLTNHYSLINQPYKYSNLKMQSSGGVL